MAAKSPVHKKSHDKYTLEGQIQDNWLPLIGCAGYFAYSVKIVQAKQFSEFFGSFSPRVEDTLWTAAGFGLAVYIYRQRFMTRKSNPWRVIYSGFNSTIFNLGSNLLIWMGCESALPKTSNSVKILSALCSGLGLLYIGWHYTTFLNSLIKDCENK